MEIRIADPKTEDKASSEFYEGIALLERSEGYANLTSRQKKLLRYSLVTSINFDDINRSRLQHLSQVALEELYCHISIDALEQESLNGEDSRINIGNLVGKNFERSGYFEHFDDANKERTSQDFLGELSKRQEFPLVVLIGWGAHSFIIFGPAEESDDPKNWITWEKNGSRKAFRVARVRDIVSEYDSYAGWGIRPLLNREKLGLPVIK